MLPLILSHKKLTVSNLDRLLAEHQVEQHPFFLHSDHIVQASVEAFVVLTDLEEDHAYVQVQGHVCFDLTHDESVHPLLSTERILSDNLNAGYFTSILHCSVLDRYNNLEDCSIYLPVFRKVFLGHTSLTNHDVDV